MVCVPCFIIPVLLILWRKFIQPYVLRYWNPWAVKDADGNIVTEEPFNCEGGVCAFGRKAKKASTEPNKDTKDFCENRETKDVCDNKQTKDVCEKERLKAE